ncbi:tetratricopeptide repeat protein [Avibacterium sp. 20-126]|uniref:tetratricopeptide repeat protein n=1 Tax=Avibacterium sp. 20-126 TaxID=2911524 RepID=UPI002186E531|nr:tetratricopeptide repeat protein [Avibacterium sp. 20-126]
MNNAKKVFDEGFNFYNNNNLEAAIKAWSSITRGDDKKVYAVSRFNLGNLYQETNEKDEAIKAWSSITREDDKKVYAMSRFNLGNLYKETNKKDEAIKAWSSITREDDKEAYAMSRFNLGNLYKETNEKDGAIRAWLNITREDNKKAYAGSRVNLGNLYKETNEKDEAIKAWSSITREDDKEYYARSLVNLGDLYKETNKKDEAIKAWKNINCDDYQEAYISAQFYLGKLYQENKEDKEAKECYKNVIKLGNSAFIYEANIHLRILEISSSNNQEELKDLFEKIDSILKKLLVYPNRSLKDCSEVAHYTRASTALLLLEIDKEKVSHFRLNSIRGVNDPKEGVLLSEYLNLDNLSEQREFISFISCFTFNHDSLNQFRLYGKENNREASGVSLVFDVNKFFSSKYLDRFLSFSTLDENLEARNDSPEENKLPLYRCIYIDPKSNYLSIAKRSKITFFRQYNDGKEKWKEYQKELKKIEDTVRKKFNSVKKIMRKINSNDNKVKELIRDILMPLQYLVKHYAFEEEQECRMVSIRSLTKDPRINVDEQFNSMYIEYPISVRDAVEKVYLSIGARDKEHFFIRKLGNHRKVVLSENPFRQK